MGDWTRNATYVTSACARPEGIMRTLLVVSGDIPLHDDVVGFCEYGVAVETTDEHEASTRSRISPPL